MKKLVVSLMGLSVASGSLGVYAHAPKGATDACRTLSSGAACHFDTPRGEVSGRCFLPPRDQVLVCAPERHRQTAAASRLPASVAPGAVSGTTTEERTQRPRRAHTVVQSDGEVRTVAANTPPIAPSIVAVDVVNGQRVLTANGVSEHLTGQFPNRGNPHGITEQTYAFKVPAEPALAKSVTQLGMYNFGLGVNGVPFDPGAAEWYLGNRNSGWQYEAMSGAIGLGLDENHAHVQPQGAYHYHGLPTLLAQGLEVSNKVHSPLIGWAADGFPIYSMYGYLDVNNARSAIVEQTSSYRVKSGNRPSGGKNPGGYYDGTFLADYEYVSGLGSLDECNGKQTRTPEFPQGTYAYFLTADFPIIPRCFKGTPSTDFTQERARQR